MSFKNIALTVALTLFAGSAWASEVYIDQSGSSTTINITQTGTTNVFSGEAGLTTASVLSGDSINIDVTKTGDYNDVELNLLNSATGTDFDLVITGSTNVFDGLVDGASGSIINTAITGDYNLVTVCGANDGTASATTGSSTSGPTCSNGISVNDTTNNITVGGDANIVNMEVASAANTTNNITIGDGLTASSSNIINVTQTNVDVNLVTISVDGSSNVINILQN